MHTHQKIIITNDKQTFFLNNLYYWSTDSRQVCVYVCVLMSIVCSLLYYLINLCFTIVFILPCLSVIAFIIFLFCFFLPVLHFNLIFLKIKQKKKPPVYPLNEHDVENNYSCVIAGMPCFLSMSHF